MTLPAYTCQQCGGAFARRSQGRPAKFCSLQCSADSRKQVITAMCKHCGVAFERRKGNYHSTPQFCSRRCSSRFQVERDPESMRRAARAASEKTKGTIRCEHGLTRYMRHGCRCDVCRAAQAAANRRNRKPVPKHGVRRYRKYGCRCGVCAAAEQRSYERQQRQWGRAGRRLVSETADSAHRWGYQWTGPELEMAAREDLTAIQVAKILGRTAYAVKHQRQLLRVDPRKVNLAGVPNRQPVDG